MITDVDGNEYFAMLENIQKMSTYAAVFDDLEGRPLVRQTSNATSDTRRCLNYRRQRALHYRNPNNKKFYPFLFLEVHPMKGLLLYRSFDDEEMLKPHPLIAQNAWLEFMLVCCTPVMRCGLR